MAGNLLETIKGWKLRGWNIRVKKVKGHLYITAYKKINGKQKEKCICRIDDKTIAVLKEYGILANNKSSSRVTRVSSISSSKRPERPAIKAPRSQSFQQGVGGSWPSVFMVHRLQLRYVRNDVCFLYLGSYGFRFDPRNKQWVRRFSIGRGRVVTVQVNSDGSAQVYLSADDAPLNLFEFLGFVYGTLVFLFNQFTGRSVGLSDFQVLSAPELNIDIPGNLLEGLGVNGKCFTLQDYYDNLVRIYLKDYASTIPNGGTRLEIRPGSWKNSSLKDVANWLIGAAEYPKLIVSIKQDLEAIKSGLDRSKINEQAFSELVATKLANFEYLLFRKLEEKLKQWITDLASSLVSKIDEYVKPILSRLQELEEENKKLRNELRRLKQHRQLNWQVYVPEKLKQLLDKLSEPGAARPALISVDYSKGMVYFSEDLWRYINSRTWYGKRGLNNELLNKIKLYDGYDAFRLILFLKKHGGKAPLSKVIRYLGDYYG